MAHRDSWFTYTYIYGTCIIYVWTKNLLSQRKMQKNQKPWLFTKMRRFCMIVWSQLKPSNIILVVEVVLALNHPMFGVKALTCQKPKESNWKYVLCVFFQRRQIFPRRRNHQRSASRHRKAKPCLQALEIRLGTASQCRDIPRLCGFCFFLKSPHLY